MNTLLAVLLLTGTVRTASAQPREWEPILSCSSRPESFRIYRHRKDPFKGVLVLPSESFPLDIAYTNAGARLVAGSRRVPQLIVATGLTRVEWIGRQWDCDGRF